jgi:RND family efflux transporter MFP subunit
MEFAKTMYEKQKRLYAQNVGTEAQLLQAEAQYESLKSQVQSLQNQYNNSKVTAPVSGIIDAKYIKEGGMAAPGIPLFRVVGGSENKVVANVAESYIQQVRNGISVKVYFPDLGKVVEGTIFNVSQTIDRASRTFQIQVKVNEKDVRTNMVAIVKILDYKNAKAITVPVNAVQNSEEGNFVLLARPNGKNFVTVKQPVIKGPSYKGKTEITQGLQEGDLLITTGFQDLVEDQAVRFKK